MEAATINGQMADDPKVTKAAAALGRLGGVARAKKLSSKRLREISAVANEARHKKVSKKRRVEIAKGAAAARWKGHKKP